MLYLRSSELMCILNMMMILRMIVRMMIGKMLVIVNNMMIIVRMFDNHVSDNDENARVE